MPTIKLKIGYGYSSHTTHEISNATWHTYECEVNQDGSVDPRSLEINVNKYLQDQEEESKKNAALGTLVERQPPFSFDGDLDTAALKKAIEQIEEALTSAKLKTLKKEPANKPKMRN